jgi:Actin interacting protein 3
MSQIEKSVTHLLVATKQLLETLTQWSRGQAQEEEVSDVYVRLGYEFNLACRAFNSIGVETSDLGPVPDLLRSILEDTLSQPASPQSLDNFLPRIRDIIINLLHGLKRKQAKLRTRAPKDPTSKVQAPMRTASGASLGSNETGLTQMLDEVPSQSQASRQVESRADSSSPREEGNGVPSRKTSSGGAAATNRHSLRRDINRSVAQSVSGSPSSSHTAQSMPVLPPYSEPEQTGSPLGPDMKSPPAFAQPPPPPPKHIDALTALQRGGDLERRASRRFSSYQISKHLGASPSGIPLIPPAQNSPAPNRGRDDRESMNAVQSRKSAQHFRQRYNNRFGELSPTRSGTVKAPEPISEESPESFRQPPQLLPPTEPIGDESPIVRTPSDMYRRGSDFSPNEGPAFSATLHSLPPSLPSEAVLHAVEKESSPVRREHQHTPMAETAEPVLSAESKVKEVTPPASQQFVPEESPPPGKELTLFLQYKSKVKKFVLPDGYEDLTTARLQLAFIEKFAWNTHNNGVDLPEIYIQDPVSGVRHELEDLSDVKDRSVLVLNVEVLDEVKRHFDDGIGDIRKMLEGVRGTLEGQGSMMERFSNRQMEASKEMARMSAVPNQAVSILNRAQSGRSTPVASAANVTEVRSLRRDIAALRQTYSSMSADFTTSMKAIKQKGAIVKSAAADAVIPTFEGNAGRAHVNNGKKVLLQDSEALVNRVDDLSDLVEDLRKDVVSRGVRPRPRQLEDVSKDISVTVKELAKMKEFLKREKPIWTKIWEKELDLVCQERDELTQQEDLMADLHGDLEDLSGVFKLVEEATKQQNVQHAATGGLRSTSRNLPIDPDIDPQRAKDGVLGEVRALQPNHENRLEAIERAEKARQRELESRKGGEFQREVEKFVEEGKLKKTGGAEEVERLRKAKDEKARKENWERAQQRQAEMETREAEQNAAALVDGEAESDGYSGAQEPLELTAEHQPHIIGNEDDAVYANNQPRTATADTELPEHEQHEIQPPGTSFLDLHTE